MRDENLSIGRYEVSAELGRGSMGIVRRAHDPVMGRDVAIKTILLPHGLTEEGRSEFHRRFLREAQAAGRLSHPGIVTVYDFHQEGDEELPFIAMEYVDGYTLHELVASEGALKPEWALSMADSLADALQVAHDAGIVHRDLKPANVLVRESDGTAKITDFGIARINLSELTHPGTTYGSPAYMAPERIEGKKADARSDLFSLAVILYEALCGRRPFAGDDFTSICHSTINDPPMPVRTWDPGLSPAFDAFFQRALAKNPANRFQDGATFREALESVRHEQLLFSSGAATQVMSTPTEASSHPEDAEAEPTATMEEALAGGAAETTAAESERTPEPRTALAAPAQAAIAQGFPKRRIAIGVAAAIAILLVVVALVGGRGATEPETPTPESSAAGTAVPTGAALPGEGVSRPAPRPASPDDRVGLPESGDPGLAAAEAAPPSPVAESTADLSATAAPDHESGSPAMPQLSTSEQEAAAVAADSPRPGGGPFAVPETPSLAEQLSQADSTEQSAVIVAAPVLLSVTVKSSIKEGALTLLVDGGEVYSAELTTESRTLNRVYRKVLRQVHQELGSEIEVAAGAHTITAQVYSEAKARTYEARLEVELEPGESRQLRIVAGRTFGKRVTMTLD